MILNAIRGGTDIIDLLVLLLTTLPAVFIAITFHEAAHGLAGYIMGDPTAKLMGRVTLNPIRHFDLFGFLSMLLLGFGWAKPVPFNPNNFKNYKLGTIVVAIAGPLANFLVAAIAYFIRIPIVLFWGGQDVYSIIGILAEMLARIAMLNLSLMIFNLIPIPPLDGSKVLFALLPKKAYKFVLQFERYGFIVLVVVLMTGMLDGFIRTALYAVWNMFGTVAEFFLKIFI